MKTGILFLLAAVTLAACSHPAGIRPVGHDVYAVSVPLSRYGSREGAEKIAAIEAENYCRALATPMIFLSSDATASNNTLEYVFRCRSKRFPGN